MKKLFLFPAPKSVEYFEGFYEGELLMGKSAPKDILRAASNYFKSSQENETVSFYQDASVPAEGYRLSVSKSGVEIVYSQGAGAYYGTVTLRQIKLQCDNKIPLCEITDSPELCVRGAMLDISRGKVPTVQTLMEQAEVLAQLKYNHLQLYIEGFSFAYPSYEKYWQGLTPITPEEIKKLKAFCAERFIELVPNQNSLGHMGGWLTHEEFRPLAECPEGFNGFGVSFPPSTLNPRAEGSVKLLEQMCDDLLPCFDSGYLNVGLDEPFELGRGENAKAAIAEGTGSLFYEWVQKMHKICADRGRKMMMWGDVLAAHTELYKSLPKDITVLDWGYEAEHPYEERAEKLKSAGLRFILCPGTNTWSSFTGITDNMLSCIKNAAQAAKKHSAAGLIVTDWGDGGHLQYLPFSYPALCFAGACAWSEHAPSEAELCKALDDFVFYDKARATGAFMLAAGRYYEKEEFLYPCRTIAFTSLLAKELTKPAFEEMWLMWQKLIELCLEEQVRAPYVQSYNKREQANFNSIYAYLVVLSQQLEAACPQSSIVKREFKNALSMVSLATRLRDTAFNAGQGIDKTEIQAVITEHRKLWAARNKPYGIDEGIASFEKFM